MKTVATICSSTKTISYLGSYQTKVVQNLCKKNYKTLLKVINRAGVAIKCIINLKAHKIQRHFKQNLNYNLGMIVSQIHMEELELGIAKMILRKKRRWNSAPCQVPHQAQNTEECAEVSLSLSPSLPPCALSHVISLSLCQINL